MRQFMNLANVPLFEDRPARERDPKVLPWLQAAHARPDIGQLFIHGSNGLFDRFQNPDTSIGRLIFSTKLVEQFRHLDYQSSAFQAEYYGRHLYLIKISYAKMFNPNPRADPQAAQLFARAIQGQWGVDDKIRYGRFDYQDAHLVVPAAVEAGYDFFRVYEMAANYDSYGAICADQITIVDRYVSAD